MATQKYATEDLPLPTMQQAAEMAGFRLDTRRNTTIVDCPFCRGEKKFYISVSMSGSSDGHGLARCMKCGEYLLPLQMFAYSQGMDTSDTKAAAREWFKLQRGEEPTSGKKKRKKPSIPEPVEVVHIDVEPASLDIRDRTYKSMLKLLTLLPEHKENLLKRGLSAQAIKSGEYKSLPKSKKNGDLICQELLTMGCVLLGVPGFYTTEDKKWHMATFGSGILIPQRNGKGQIQSLQIRRDSDGKTNGPRYMSFSSREKLNGAPAYAHCHFRLGKKGMAEIILTEGPLKADVIACLTGYSVLAVPGVNSLAFLPQALFDLKKAGMKKVVMAYDMDIRTNKEVQKAEKSLMRLLSRAGIYHSRLKWDERLKGLDDWAVAQPELTKKK